MSRAGVWSGAGWVVAFVVLSGCSSDGAPTDTGPEVDSFETDADHDTDVDGLELDGEVTGEVSACRSDLDCVAVIGGVGICERAACNTLTGQCVRTAKVDGTPCSDRNACTPNDTCRSASCVGLGLIGCDDNNPCTADRCEPLTGCVHTATEGFCEDQDLCTERERCTDGRCTGTPIECDDDDPCTSDRCDPESGCLYRAIDPCEGSPG